MVMHSLPPPHTLTLKLTHPPTHTHTHSNSNVPIGRVSYTPEQLVSNITSAIKGVGSHVPQGLRNVQSVHLKTPDSIALPIYNSLPPPPGLLPATTDKVPAAKRLKLDTGSDENESEDEESLSEGRRRKPTTGLRFEEGLEGGEDGGAEEGEGRGGRSKVRRARLSKLSVKKVRGSTVRSSKYEKALRRKTVT